MTSVPLSSAAIAIGEMAKAKDKVAIFTAAASSVLSGERCGPNHLHWVYDTWGIPHAIEAAMGADHAKASGRAALAQMRKIPVHDPIFGTSVIRDDGRVTHPIYLLEAKAPHESKEKWDLLKVKGIIPIDQAFRPMADGHCPMIKA